MLFYIYDINNMKMPYILDNRPAMFDTRELADRMCHIMNFVLKDHDFIVVCKRGLSKGARVRATYNTEVFYGTITDIKRVGKKSARVLFDVKCDNGMQEWFRDYELESVVE